MSPNKYPALKPGVGIAVTSDDRSLIGFAHRGVSQYLPTDTSLAELLSFLKNLDGREVSIPPQYQALIENLSENKLLEWVELKDPTNANQLSVNHLLHQEVIKPEVRLFAWGGLSEGEFEIEARAQINIAIYGDNRLALSLLNILHNTGFTGANFIVFDKKRGKISTPHLNALGIQLNDLGLSFKDYAAKSVKNSRFASAKVNEKPDLIISTIKPFPHHQQQWISEELPHLHISDLSEKYIEIGPCVLPGKTACNRCIENWRQDFAPELSAIFDQLSSTKELPTSAISFLAGLVVLQLPLLLKEIKGEVALTSPLSQSMVRINLLEPAKAHEIFWPPHPECGCYTLPNL